MTRRDPLPPKATRGSCQLTALLQAVPPGRRGVILQSAVSFRPSASPDECFAIEQIRAAFAGYWEARFGRPVPAERLLALLKPPVSIATVIECNKLMLTRNAAEIEAAIRQLGDHLQARLREVDRLHGELPDSA